MPGRPGSGARVARVPRLRGLRGLCRLGRFGRLGRLGRRQAALTGPLGRCLGATVEGQPDTHRPPPSPAGGPHHRHDYRWRRTLSVRVKRPSPPSLSLAANTFGLRVPDTSTRSTGHRWGRSKTALGWRDPIVRPPGVRSVRRQRSGGVKRPLPARLSLAANTFGPRVPDTSTRSTGHRWGRSKTALGRRDPIVRRPGVRSVRRQRSGGVKRPLPASAAPGIRRARVGGPIGSVRRASDTAARRRPPRATSAAPRLRPPRLGAGGPVVGAR